MVFFFYNACYIPKQKFIYVLTFKLCETASQFLRTATLLSRATDTLINFCCRLLFQVQVAPHPAEAAA